MMDRRWFSGLMIVLGLSLLADYYFLHILFPQKKAAMVEEFNRRVNEHLRSEEPPTSPENAPLPDSGIAPAATTPTDESSARDTFREAFTACFGENAHDDHPTDLITRLSNRVEARETDIENWHVLRPDGHEERLMLVASDRENAGGRKELRLFAVDAEGLPVPQPIDEETSLDPTPEQVQALLSPGEVRFHQKRERLRFADGTSASVEWVDGGVREMQVFLASRTLACRNLDCRCL